MASYLNNLEEEITCSICYEVYRNPHLLKQCLHIFCLQCIQQLEKNGRVECPECRAITRAKDIKKDFKIQSVIDAIATGKEDSDPSKDGFKGCEMCREEGQYVKYHCNNCSQFMCKKCKTTHSRMKICKGHKVRSIDQTMKASKKEINKMIKDLQREKKDSNSRSQSVDKVIKEIVKCQMQQMQSVEKYSEEIIKAVRENEKKLKKTIQDANTATITNLKERSCLLRDSEYKIQREIDSLQDLIQEKDINTIMKSMENMKQNVKESMSKMKEDLPTSTNSHAISPVHVTKGIKLDLESCIIVTIDQDSCRSDQDSFSSGQINLGQEPAFSQLCSKDYIQSEVISLDFYPHKLSERNDQIWCSGSKVNGQGVIAMYNQNGEKIKSITHDKLRDIGGFCVVEDHVIVTTGTHLYQLDLSGNLKASTTGMFADVCHYGGDFYVLEISKRIIQVFTYKLKKWRKDKKLKLGQLSCHKCDKIYVNKTGIYISSFVNNRIYIYDWTGQIQHTVYQSSNRITLCDVDDSNNLVVADRRNKQIKLYNKLTGWNKVSVSGDIGQQNCTLVDARMNIWVVNSQEKLLKFIQK